MSIKIALAGNPNCGKTTLFNALTGSNQFVGNWPGVTVEKKEGALKGHKDVTVIDLPGIYSLSPYTLEEVVTRNYLLTERPDVILNIVDGTNLERNLYLSTQLMELGIPVLMAVNMMDIVEKNGDKLKVQNLGKSLGCEVLEISALKGIGIEKAALKAVTLAEKKEDTLLVHRFAEGVEGAIAEVIEKIGEGIPGTLRRFYAIKLLEQDAKIKEQMKIVPEVSEQIQRLEAEFDDDTESIFTNERYVYISSIISECCVKNRAHGATTSDKIDRIVTNRFLALPIFAAVMFLVYFVSVTTVGTWATDWANDGVFGEGFQLFGAWVPGIPVLVEMGLDAISCAEWLKSLILDGIVTGVGAVLGFVPQMLVLFAFLAFLEACGYMARVAFIMDRIFRKFGLSGKSFIPMLIGSGCGVPGIMASRTIENEKDRRMTIMTTTFIPCGAKLPIIALVSGALFGGAWWVAPSAYFVGIAAVVISGIVLKRTKMFAGEPAPFVMELPAYHMPTFGNIGRSMWERGSSFVRKAGTIILLSTVVLWFLMRFGFSGGSFGLLPSEQLDKSILAMLGSILAPLFAPLGWGNWEMAVAAVTGLIAKENVVGTIGILYGFSEVAENGAEVWSALSVSITAAGAYSFLVFNLLCAPCFAAIGAMKREMNNKKWFWFAISYQTLLAYVVSLVIYQATAFFTEGYSFGTLLVGAVLLVILGRIVYGMRRDKKNGASLHCGGDCGHCGGHCK